MMDRILHALGTLRRLLDWNRDDGAGSLRECAGGCGQMRRDLPDDGICGSCFRQV